ncbi:class I SAM-dependent methyltransferase [Chitinophaga niabensis]|uniref:Methyltransferase domain-containing protein n=1 Tax=Chitinophaga niabensis TaxID=536979 RepID=A0A1N6DPK2_9BACT|nr:class I SAM-dependent methyltransferase [Chitinophaga niabensis]SIN72739.1 Methyltransferase domain-containing protein [Chitinophaga niabensis]
MDLVEQKYWDDSYNSFTYFVANDIVTQWMNKHAAYLEKGGQLFELGCYPGRYIAHLGKMGFVVNGMDLAPNMDEGFRAWLQKEGVQTGMLEKGDVLAYAANTTDRYDMVCSFGFIEHFQNFQEIIALHDKLLKPGGKLMITTPNFRGGLQQFLHRNLDKGNLDRHYLPSMKPYLWKAQLEQLGYDVQFAGYFGRFDYWYDVQERSSLQKLGNKVVHKLTPLLRQLPDAAFQSPYCGILAQKRKA